MMEKQVLFENVKRNSTKFEEEDQQTQEKETAKKL